MCSICKNCSIKSCKVVSTFFCIFHIFIYFYCTTCISTFINQYIRIFA